MICAFDWPVLRYLRTPILSTGGGSLYVRLGWPKDRTAARSPVVFNGTSDDVVAVAPLVSCRPRHVNVLAKRLSRRRILVLAA